MTAQGQTPKLLPCLDSDAKSRLAVTGVPKLVSAVEMRGEAPRAHTLSLTLMRLSAQHLFSLSNKPECLVFVHLKLV